MIIVDTSVWIEHFRRPNSTLVALLERDGLAQHAFVTGELALGNSADRAALVGFLGSLTAAEVCTEGALLEFVERERLGGSGIGFVDAHLLAAAAALGFSLWTSDKRLHDQAARLDLLFVPD